MTTGALTIQDNDTLDQYTAVGESTFVFNFPILENDELKVSRNQTLLTFGVDYSITGLGDDAGGYITLLLGASTPGDIWTLWQDMPIERLTGFSAGAATILGSALNAEFSARLRVEQQLRREIRNCLHVPPDDPISGQDLALDQKSVRAGKFLAWDAAGNPISSAGTGNDSALRTDLAAGTGAQLVGRLLADAGAGLLSADRLLGTLITPEDFGAAGDNVTDDAPAIRAAQAALEARGGGVLWFTPGKTYVLTSTLNTNVVVPVAGANLTPATQSMPYHVRFNNCDSVHWQLNGATLRSTKTNGGCMFLFDGARNCSVKRGSITSVTTKDGAGVVTQAGMNGFSFTSQTRDSYACSIESILANSVYVPLYVFGDASSAFRCSSFTFKDVYHNLGVYTVALHDNGDNVRATGITSHGANRELFVYGADGWHVEIKSTTLAFAGYGSNIKAYDRDTTNGYYQLRTPKSSSDTNLNIESQHVPAVQATPKTVRGVHVHIDNRDNAGNQVAIGFNYFQDVSGAVPIAVANTKIFDGIKLSGTMLQPPNINVTQTGGGASQWGTLDTDDLILLNGGTVGLYDNKGFKDPKQSYNTYVPLLTFGGAAVGMTYNAGSTAGEYWRDGRFIEGFVRIVLTAKGSSAGSAAISLPIKASALNVVNAMIHGEGQANMAGLTGLITGFVTLNGTTMVLRQQGAAAVSSLTEGNFTNTSDVRIWFRYPIA